MSLSEGKNRNNSEEKSMSLSEDKIRNISEEKKVSADLDMSFNEEKNFN